MPQIRFILKALFNNQIVLKMHVRFIRLTMLPFRAELLILVGALLSRPICKCYILLINCINFIQHLKIKNKLTNQVTYQISHTLICHHLPSLFLHIYSSNTY